MGDVDQLRHTRERYYTSPMSMGKRKRDRQPAMWVTTTDLPTAASHPFYRRLNQLLREHGFDDFVEAQCAGFYAATMGRPGLPPWDLFPTADWLLRRHRLRARPAQHADPLLGDAHGSPNRSTRAARGPARLPRRTPFVHQSVGGLRRRAWTGGHGRACAWPRKRAGFRSTPCAALLGPVS
jgi:hypothetical protein